jgi:C_GCAxxG_C_C family probable redox protein
MTPSNHAEQAVAMFQEGFNCAQAVLAACGVPLGLPRDVALHVAGAMGGGIGGMGGTCGAVTGAIMTIGLKYAKTSPADDASKQKAYQLAKQFAAQFKQRNESILCRELLGCDISTPEGMKHFRESGLHGTVCPKLVRDAAEIVERLLAESQGQGDAK